MSLSHCHRSQIYIQYSICIIIFVLTFHVMIWCQRDVSHIVIWRLAYWVVWAETLFNFQLRKSSSGLSFTRKQGSIFQQKNYIFPSLSVFQDLYFSLAFSRIKNADDTFWQIKYLTKTSIIQIFHQTWYSSIPETYRPLSGRLLIWIFQFKFGIQQSVS